MDQRLLANVNLENPPRHSYITEALSDTIPRSGLYPFQTRVHSTGHVQLGRIQIRRRSIFHNGSANPRGPVWTFIGRIRSITILVNEAVSTPDPELFERYL